MAEYIEEAIKSFRDLMAKRKHGAMENVMREQKGELFALHFLSKRDNNVLPSEISAALASSPARVSALLGTLEKKGQIERQIDPNNRRNILVSITDDGRARITAEMSKWAQVLEEVFSEMGEVDAKEYLRLSEQFHNLFQKHSANMEE